MTGTTRPITDEQIIDLILLHEGGTYTNDPKDAGGPTRWGITIPVLSLWRGRPCTAADIKALTRDEAANVYRAQFVRPFDGLPEPVRVNIIDMGVNAGVRRAVMLAQQMLGVDVDGDIGPDTRKAFTTRPGDEWNDLFVGIRLAFYERLVENKPSQVRFRRGWRNRALSFYKGRALQSIRAATNRRGAVRGSVFGPMAKAA